MNVRILVLVIVTSTGCRAQIAGNGTRVGAAASDPGFPDPTPAWSGVEVCGNGLDDSGDGAVDEGCPCFGDGTRQGCWAGEPGKRGLGACSDGEQHCIPDGEFSTWGPCVGAVYPIDEIAGNGIDENCDGSDETPVCTASEFGEGCGNGRDDDCDGLLDCADPDCAGAIAETGEACNDGRDQDCDGAIDCTDPDCASAPSCTTGTCPDGETPTYTSPNIGFGGSGIDCGHSGPIMTFTCEPGTACPPGQVAISIYGGEDSGFGGGGPRYTMCVPAPPTCPAGESPMYEPASSSWTCLPPCDDCLIRYGGIYGNELHCAPPPPTCYDGLTPTFRQETETWTCEPECDGGLYDPHTVGGVTVCVPC